MKSEKTANKLPTDEKTLFSVRIDTHMSDYKGFFDHEWARVLTERVPEKHVIVLPLSELLFSLKAASNAFRFPWLTAESHTRFMNGFFDSDDPLPIKYIRMVRDTLKKTARSRQGAHDIDDAVSLASDMAFKAMADRRKLLDEKIGENSFREYLKIPEFQLSIIGLMRNTYASLVFAYEHFFVCCFRIKANDSTAESFPSDRFRKRVEQQFDTRISVDCWTGDCIRKCFEIRNSLAHQGSRFTKKLKHWEDEIESLNGMVQITATDNRMLFQAIKERVDMLVDDLLT